MTAWKSVDASLDIFLDMLVEKRLQEFRGILDRTDCARLNIIVASLEDVERAFIYSGV